VGPEDLFQLPVLLPEEPDVVFQALLLGLPHLGPML
jgi:hypothetical protein